MVEMQKRYGSTLRGGSCAFALLATCMALAVCMCSAVCARSAYAADDLQAGGVLQDGALETQASYPSSYAIVKSDGYLHRTNEGHTQDYGTLWGDSHSEASAALDAVTTLYIDYDVTSLTDSVKIRHMNGSTTSSRGIEFTGNNLVTGTHNVRTIEFVVKDGKNQLQVIGGTYSWYMFSKLTTLTTVKNLDKTQLTNIPSGMFFDCTNLTSISLPSTANTVGQYAFQNCKNLSSVTVPSGIAKIDNRAFENCVILKSIDLPASVNAIDSAAFYGCSSLSKVILRSPTVVDARANSFSDTPVSDSSSASSPNARIYVPNGLVDQYKSTDSTNGWRNYKDHIAPFLSIGAIGQQTHTGSAITPAVSVTWMGDNLAASNYSVTYSNNVNPGTATVTVTGKGKCAGYSDSTTFEIVKSERSSQEGQEDEEGQQNGESQQDGHGQQDGESQQTPTGVAMHRLYNPNTGEHFYTADEAERDRVMGAGWTYEGVGWTAPSSSNTPVYRLYNSYGGEHHYCMSVDERDTLLDAGWLDEGVGWYSDDAQTTPLYRDYNPNAFANNHNYTVDATEHQVLMDAGWQDEGYAWYGL